jgi:hypothetical protein
MVSECHCYTSGNDRGGCKAGCKMQGQAKCDGTNGGYCNADAYVNAWNLVNGFYNVLTFEEPTHSMRLRKRIETSH